MAVAPGFVPLDIARRIKGRFVRITDDPFRVECAESLELLPPPAPADKHSLGRICRLHRRCGAGKVGARLPQPRRNLCGPRPGAERWRQRSRVRVSRATFDPVRFAVVDAMNIKVSGYLISAIKQLPGLLHFYPGVSPEGSAVHVSVCDSDEHTAQLDHLKEMVVIARGQAEAVGVRFHPIVNYPINWTI